jgi:predicted glycogen debranching enzyme
MKPVVRRIPWPEEGHTGWAEILSREWLVTNGLGGYASGTVCGVPTRRFHGLLVAALPAPYGRMMLFNHVTEEVVRQDGRSFSIGGEEREEGKDRTAPLPGTDHLREFRLESGLPVWSYDLDGLVLEKRVVLPYGQNTVHLHYRLGAEPDPRPVSAPVRVRVRPQVHIRPHEAPLDSPGRDPYVLTVQGDRYEVSLGPRLPALRLCLRGVRSRFICEPQRLPDVLYRVEESRGYDAKGTLWSPGVFEFDLTGAEEATLAASTEPWEAIEALHPAEVLRFERRRRQYLVECARIPAEDPVAADLVVGADQFVITPAGRVEDVARAQAQGDEVRTVIAGYHWFTDWGRDTMISLPGLTLVTGRHQEARWILRTFAHYVRDGLIPNLFPEGENQGLYHTADATLWFFNAIDRYLAATGDRLTLRLLLPTLVDIVEHHLRGTRFGIGVDSRDGLLGQGQEGYQLTWMDAKVDGWVVTPRRGKAVEINALWYNALCLLAGWLAEEQGERAAAPLREDAARARESFNRRFWYAEGGYLYDVVDGETGDDPACRPNQIFAISLACPVLDQDRWAAVMDVVTRRLLTPVGLRSLAPGHADYKPRYDGDLRARDAAYHQGTVWGWLIGPYVDAWLKLHPGQHAQARALLQGFVPELGRACIGSISEVFDAEEPYTPRGCVAQAWSVAEVLRCWVKTAADRTLSEETATCG